LAGVITAFQADGAGIESHRDGKQFERRAHLVDPFGSPVESRVAARGCRIVGVEIGQRHHGHEFTAVGVEHQPGSAEGPEFTHRRGEFLAQHRLDAKVQRQLEAVAGTKGLVETHLHPGDAVAVDVGQAEHMGGQTAMRIDPAFAALKAEARKPKPVDPVLLFRGQVAADPDETALRFDLRQDVAALEGGQHLDQLIGGLLGVQHRGRVGVQRRRR